MFHLIYYLSTPPKCLFPCSYRKIGIIEPHTPTHTHKLLGIFFYVSRFWEKKKKKTTTKSIFYFCVWGCLYFKLQNHLLYKIWNLFIFGITANEERRKSFYFRFNFRCVTKMDQIHFILLFFFFSYNLFVYPFCEPWILFISFVVWLDLNLWICQKRFKSFLMFSLKTSHQKTISWQEYFPKSTRPPLPHKKGNEKQFTENCFD